MKALLTTICLVMASAINATAASPCRLRLNVNNVSLTWSTTLPTQQIPFTVRKQRQPACNYTVTFSKGNSTNYSRYLLGPSSTHLNYNLYRDSALTSILKDIPDITSPNDAITGSFGTGSGQTHNLNYFLNIPLADATTPTLKQPGTYVDTITVRVFSSTSSDPNVPDDTASVNIQTVVPKNLQLSLVSSGGSFDPNSTSQNLSFGTMSEGNSRSFDMRVLTNAGYSVTFSSQNNGVMRHSSPSITSNVSYGVTVNGVPRSLVGSAGSPVVVATGGGQTTLSGALNPVTITIGSLATAMAGSYSDYITVTAATTE